MSRPCVLLLALVVGWWGVGFLYRYLQRKGLVWTAWSEPWWVDER